MQKRLNIWMITKWYPNREDPQVGVFIQKHARAISMYNNIGVLYIHPIINLSNDFEIDERENNDLKEVLIYFKKNKSVFGKIINSIRYLVAINKGIKILSNKISNPDILHAYILTRTGIVAWYLSFRKKIPFIISEQWSGYVTGNFLKSPFLKKMITRFIARKASAITSVSSYLLDGMKTCGLINSVSRIIPNIIENTEVNTLPINRNQINVLMVADLVDEIKNISGVIRMISQTDHASPFILRIIGGGPDEAKLKKLASDLNLRDRIIFFEGQKNNSEVYTYLRNCDFLILNSRYETFSLICAEAMSCGKPVLATACGGPNEFVNTETGLLIEPENELELKNKFLYMLGHFKNYDSVRIKQYANELFSMEKAGKAFQMLYSIILNRSQD